MRLIPLVALVHALAALAPAALRAAESVVTVDPPALTLIGPKSQQYLLIHERLPEGIHRDLTRTGKYRVADERIATVDANGLVRGIADGKTSIQVDAGGHSFTVAVTVSGSSGPRAFHFENDILPLLSRYGCNSSGCHGKAEGQNGFKLSVFAFDPAADFSALIKESRGRRIFPAVPDKSLLLTKASGQVAHGGGNRVPVNSEAFETIRDWVAAGAPFGDANAPRIASIRIEPSERVLTMHAEQQLRVMATYSDGRVRDVTTQSRFQSNNDAVAVVSAEGIVRTADVPGEAAVMASFLNEVASFRLMLPRPDKVDFPKLSVNNFIDPLVDAKLKKLNIAPSGPVDDYTFVRRVFLDVIGTLPTPDEVRTFVKDTAKDNRAKLVDALLARPEYADYWALKWADVLRVDRAVLGHKRALAYYRWIHDGVADNKPFDRFARELITAEGPLDESPPANFFRVVNKPGEAASAIAQVFLGARIACAECHHHPYDRWGQDDYYQMSAYFAPLSVKKIASADALVVGTEFSARNPRSGVTLPAAPLGVKGGLSELTGDRREQLAAWMVAANNPFFARNIVNRYWAHFLGRGIVEPVDDMRSTNPPSNPELLDALAASFQQSGYDVKKLVRAIVLSRVYQTESKPNPVNERDEQNYSRALFRRLDAEVFLDMVSQTMGVPEKFDGQPNGTRAIQLWDNKLRHYFLKTFGRPARISACECERNEEPNIAQVLHLLNSETVFTKLRHEAGTVNKLLIDIGDDGKLTEEMFMIFVARPPSEKEKTAVVDYVRQQGAGKRRQAFEDVAWALLNSKEFMFNH
jgi:hypothetical protein